MKIKITEYFPEATIGDISNHQKNAANGINSSALSSNGNNPIGATTLFFPNGGSNAGGSSQSFGMLTPGPTLSENSPLAANGQKLYTIQRVNGNGGNGKTDGIGGGHRHTLEDSDRVKKNSVHRYLLKKSKDEKKAVVSHIFFLVWLQEESMQMSGIGQAWGSCIKTYFILRILHDENQLQLKFALLHLKDYIPSPILEQILPSTTTSCVVDHG